MWHRCGYNGHRQGQALEGKNHWQSSGGSRQQKEWLPAGKTDLGSQAVSVGILELSSDVVQKDPGVFLIKIVSFNRLPFSLA